MTILSDSASEFTRYYEEHKNAIFNYILYRVSFDRDTAEDLTSEVFIKAFENFERYDRERSFKTWIFTIAHNHLINYLMGRKPVISLDETIEILPDKSESSYGDQIDHRMLMGKMMHIINEMPDNQRELLTMRFVNDLSNSEIAGILGKDEGAVRTGLSRAIGTLRNQYNINLSPSSTNNG